jgi:hypothetical protein
LYQSTNPLTQFLALAMSSKAFSGYSGRYFDVLNHDSKYGLSLLTDGRLNEWTSQLSLDSF